MPSVPRLCEFYPGICLRTEEKVRKNLSQGKKNLSQSTVHILPKLPIHYKTTHTLQNYPHITKLPTHYKTYTHYKTTHTLQNLYTLQNYPHITKLPTHYKTYTYYKTTHTLQNLYTLQNYPHITKPIHIILQAPYTTYFCNFEWWW